MLVVDNSLVGALLRFFVALVLLFQVAGATTQLIENSVFSVSKTYTIAATDTSFIVRNIDLTVGNLNINGPSNGILPAGITILVEDCDLTTGTVNILTESQDLHLTGGATLTVRDNTAVQFLVFYVSTGHTSTRTLTGSTIIFTENTATSHCQILTTWAGVSSYTQNSGTLQIYSNNIGGDMEIGNVGSTSSSLTWVIKSGISVYSNVITGMLRFFRSASTGTASITVSDGGVMNIFSNTITNQLLIGDVRATSSVTITGSGSAINVYTNTLPSNNMNFFSADGAGVSLTLTVSDGGTFQAYSNDAQGAHPLALLNAVTAYNGATIDFDATTGGHFLVYENTHQNFNLVDAHGSSTAITMDVTGGSTFQFNHNTGNGGQLFRVVSGASLTMMTTTSSVLEIQGNTLVGTVRAFECQEGTLSVTTTQSSLIQFNGNTIGGQTTFSIVHVYGSVGGTHTFILSSSSRVEIVGNVIQNFLRVGVAIASTTSASVSLTTTTSSASSWLISRNTAETTDPHFAFCFALTSSSAVQGSASITASTTSSSKIEIVENNFGAYVLAFCSGPKAQISSTLTSASLFDIQHNVVGTNVRVGYATEVGNVDMTVSQASTLTMINNIVPIIYTYGEIALGGTFSSTVLSSGRLFTP